MFITLLLMSCAASTTSTLAICEVDLVEVSPAEVSPGDPAVLTARPVTTDNDTALYISGARAAITSVDRVGCEECDTCREDSACTVCQDCDDCDAICDADCLETVSFTVPQLAAGAASLQLFNTYGASEGLAIEILPGDTAAPK